MHETNHYTRATILARETVERLQRGGYSHDEARQLVVMVIDAEAFALMTKRHTFNEDRFMERLNQLPG
jgi:class 3 adenylate cyclase